MGQAETDSTGRLVANIDPRLLDFLETNIDSFVKWDLIRFFHDNPHTTDTARNIAIYAGRHGETIRQDLDQLAENGVLQSDKLRDMTVFSLSSDPEIRELLKEFVEASADRHFRIKAIYHIIRGIPR